MMFHFTELIKQMVLIYSYCDIFASNMEPFLISTESMWTNLDLFISLNTIDGSMKYLYNRSQRDILVRYGVVSCMPFSRAEIDWTDTG